MQELTTSDARAHARELRSGRVEIRDHLRRDIDKVDDPKARALFETAAEVLSGLGKAFEDYEQGRERAWR